MKCTIGYVSTPQSCLHRDTILIRIYLQNLIYSCKKLIKHTIFSNKKKLYSCNLHVPYGYSSTSLTNCRHILEAQLNPLSLKNI